MTVSSARGFSEWGALCDEGLYVMGGYPTSACLGPGAVEPGCRERL